MYSESLEAHVVPPDKGGCGADYIPGWVDLLEQLHKDLLEIAPEYKILQIKEKFGTLRFYTDNLPKEAEKLVWLAEEATESICIQCGNHAAAKIGCSRVCHKHSIR